MSINNDQQGTEQPANAGNDVTGEQPGQTTNVNDGADATQGASEGSTNNSHGFDIGTLVKRLDGEVTGQLVDGVEHAIEQVGIVIGVAKGAPVVGWFARYAVEAVDKLEEILK